MKRIHGKLSHPVPSLLIRAKSSKQRCVRTSRSPSKVAEDNDDRGEPGVDDEDEDVATTFELLLPLLLLLLLLLTFVDATAEGRAAALAAMCDRRNKNNNSMNPLAPISPTYIETKGYIHHSNSITSEKIHSFIVIYLLPL